MPGFGGFAAVPEGYNEAEKNQQIVQALILDLQQKQAQQQASGLAFGAFSRGAQQPGATPIPGAQPTGLPSPPPTQAALAPGAGAGTTPAGPAPGAPTSAGIPGGTPAPTGASGAVPGQGTSIIGNSGQPNTLRMMAANRYPGNQQTAQAINYVANALGVSPDQPLTPTQQSNASQMFPNLDPGGGVVPPTTAAPGQVQSQPIPPPVQTAAIPGGQSPGAAPAPPAGAPAQVPIPQARPAGMGPGMPAGTQVSGAAAGGAGAAPPPAAPPPAAGAPGAPAGAPQPGRQALSWQDSVNWINQEADRQEQATGRKISSQQRWMALQQMLPFMTEDAKAQHEQVIADLKAQHEQELVRKDQATEEQARKKLEFEYTREADRHTAAEERIENTRIKLEQDEQKIQETIRNHDITAAQRAKAETDLQEIRVRKAVNEEDRTAEIARHNEEREAISRYGIDVGAATKLKVQEDRSATQIKTTGMRDESAERRTDKQIAGRLEGQVLKGRQQSEQLDKRNAAQMERAMVAGSPGAQYYREFLKNNPNATEEDKMRVLKSIPSAANRALEEKERVAVGKIQNVRNQLQEAINHLQNAATGGKSITGFSGMINRGLEWGQGMLGRDHTTEAGDFESLIKTLHDEVTEALKDTRVTAADRKEIDKIVRGLSPFTDPQGAANSLIDLRRRLGEKLQTVYGVSEGMPNVNPPGTEGNPHRLKSPDEYNNVQPNEFYVLPGENLIRHKGGGQSSLQGMGQAAYG